METFIGKTENPALVASTFVMPLLETVLTDYQTTVMQVREPDVLTLCATIVERLNTNIMSSIHPILANVFQCTLDMITNDFQEYPEHRVGFYRLLREVNFHCFQSLLELPEAQFKV